MAVFKKGKELCGKSVFRKEDFFHGRNISGVLPEEYYICQFSFFVIHWNS